VFYASVTGQKYTVYTVFKPTYFTAMIDNVFCLDARVIRKRETLSVVMLVRSEMSRPTYKTSDTVVRDMMIK